MGKGGERTPPERKRGGGRRANHGARNACPWAGGRAPKPHTADRSPGRLCRRKHTTFEPGVQFRLHVKHDCNGFDSICSKTERTETSSIKTKPSIETCFARDRSCLGTLNSQLRGMICKWIPARTKRQHVGPTFRSLQYTQTNFPRQDLAHGRVAELPSQKFSNENPIDFINEKLRCLNLV